MSLKDIKDKFQYVIWDLEYKVSSIVDTASEKVDSFYAAGTDKLKREYENYEEKHREYLNGKIGENGTIEYEGVKQKNERLEEIEQKYNQELNIINNQRIEMRHELEKLYGFLNDTGGDVGSEMGLADFETETNKIHIKLDEVEKLPEPDGEDSQLKRKDLLRRVIDIPEHLSINKHNKECLNEFRRNVQGKENQYEKDLSDREDKIKRVEDADRIAVLYRDCVIMVKDAIAKSIIPEMSHIQAFLRADAIKDRILDGRDLTDIESGKVGELAGTLYDEHYQFVKNAFEFYKVSSSFFQRTVLSDLLSNNIEVAEGEINQFKEKVERIMRETNRGDEQ